MDNQPDTTIIERARKDIKDSNYQTIADVKWSDLEFYVEKARREKDKTAFDTAMRVLEGLKDQVLNRESTS